MTNKVIDLWFLICPMVMLQRSWGNGRILNMHVYLMLQSRFHILTKSCHLWNESAMKTVIATFVILHHFSWNSVSPYVHKKCHKCTSLLVRKKLTREIVLKNRNQRWSSLTSIWCYSSIFVFQGFSYELTYWRNGSQTVFFQWIIMDILNCWVHEWETGTEFWVV